MKTLRIIVSLLLILGITGFVLSEYAYADIKVPKPKGSNFGQLALFIHLTFVFFLWPVFLGLNWLLFSSFPNRTERLSTLFEHNPRKCLLLGLVNLFIIFVIVVVTLEHLPPLGIIFSIIAVVVLFIGLHGRSRILGRKILRASGHDGSIFAETTVGWTTVAFISGLPIAGWAMFIYFIVGGLGAVTLSFFKKPAKSGGVDLDSHLD